MGGPTLGRKSQVWGPALATRLLKDRPETLTTTVTQLMKDCTRASMSVTYSSKDLPRKNTKRIEAAASYRTSLPSDDGSISSLPSPFTPPFI